MSGDPIEVRNVSKRFKVPLDHAGTLQYRLSHPRSSSRFRDLRALDDVTFHVARGEFIGITGPNGCGKSTLLKLMAGILVPDSGTVTINGRISPFLELGVGFKPELSARENIYLGATMLGLTQRETDERIATVLEFAELEAFADQKLKNFSSGMAVRLAFSVAMLADADILLMDEVLAVGDARFQEKCFEVFAHYKSMNRTIVLVSHDLRSLENFCDRVLLLQNGRAVVDGAAHEVVSIYRRMVASMSEPEAPAAVPRELQPSRRWGSRQVEITAVRLMGGDGTPRHTFLTDDMMTIAVDYVRNADVEGFECGLRVRDAKGLALGKPWTKTSQYRIARAAAGTGGTITYTIPALALLQGSYLLSAYLYDPHLQHAFDHVEDALEFRVADAEARFGIIELGGVWDDRVSAPVPSIQGASSGKRLNSAIAARASAGG